MSSGGIKMIDINELRRLAQAVIGWGCCNQAWLDQSEDTPAAVVGHINEDGETYPVVTVDCDQYSAAGQSLPLGKFYAAANPAVINELLHRLEAAEKERDALQARIEALERQEPVGKFIQHPSHGMWEQDGYSDNPDAKPLYLAPGAKGEGK